MCTLVSDLAPDGSCHFLRQQHVALPPLMLVVAHQGKVGVCVSVGVCVCVSVCLQNTPKVSKWFNRRQWMRKWHKKKFQDFSGVPRIICVGSIGSSTHNHDQSCHGQFGLRRQLTARPVASQPCELIHFRCPPRMPIAYFSVFPVTVGHVCVCNRVLIWHQPLLCLHLPHILHFSLT